MAGKKPLRRTLILIASLLALAAGLLSGSRNAVLAESEHTIQVSHAYPHALVDLYQVALRQPDGSLKTNSRFESAGIDFNAADPSEFAQISALLYEKIQNESMVPDARVRLDENGQALIPGLREGLYLAAGPAFRNGSEVWITNPVLIDTSAHSEKNIILKSSSLAYGTDLLSVRKEWQDESGNPIDAGSDQIEVNLYINDLYSASAILCDANLWQHTWHIASPGASWSVEEAEIPEGYTCSIEQDGLDFVIINKKTSSPPQTNPPADPPQTPGDSNKPNMDSDQKRPDHQSSDKADTAGTAASSGFAGLLLLAAASLLGFEFLRRRS